MSLPLCGLSDPFTKTCVVIGNQFAKTCVMVTRTCVVAFWYHGGVSWSVSLTHSTPFTTTSLLRICYILNIIWLGRPVSDQYTCPLSSRRFISEELYRMVGDSKIVCDSWQFRMHGRDVTFSRAAISWCTISPDVLNGGDFMSFVCRVGLTVRLH